MKNDCKDRAYEELENKLQILLKASKAMLQADSTNYEQSKYAAQLYAAIDNVERNKPINN